jgi:succinate dehydrogenase/fumarate reductase cytochrome b subunit
MIAAAHAAPGWCRPSSSARCLWRYWLFFLSGSVDKPVEPPAAGARRSTTDRAAGFDVGTIHHRRAAMYFISVVLLMLLLPAGSIWAEHSWFHSTAPLMLLAGKWFVFWSAGVRLLLAGVRQYFQPRFTSEKIFGIASDDALPIVRELGVANFATGVVGTASLARPDFVLPVAIAAAIFYGIAGIRHVSDRDRNANQTIAMVSDLFAALIFAAYVGLLELG